MPFSLFNAFSGRSEAVVPIACSDVASAESTKICRRQSIPSNDIIQDAVDLVSLGLHLNDLAMTNLILACLPESHFTATVRNVFNIEAGCCLTA